MSLVGKPFRARRGFPQIDDSRRGAHCRAMRPAAKLLSAMICTTLANGAQAAPSQGTSLAGSLAASDAADAQAAPCAQGTARELYAIGGAYADREEYAVALSCFERAYEAESSAHLLRVIADVNQLLGRTAAQAVALQRRIEKHASEIDMPEAQSELEQVMRGLTTVTVSSEPPGALIRIGGREVGQTPLEGLVVEPGSYELTLELDGHVPVTASVVFLAGDSAAIERTLGVAPAARPAPDTYVAITCGRAGVSVVLDQVLLGTTPLHHRHPLEPGVHHFSFVDSGRLLSDRKVSVRAGSAQSVDCGVPHAPAGPTAQARRRDTFEWLGYAGLATGVALGAATALHYNWNSTRVTTRAQEWDELHESAAMLSAAQKKREEELLAQGDGIEDAETVTVMLGVLAGVSVVGGVLALWNSETFLVPRATADGARLTVEGVW